MIRFEQDFGGSVLNLATWRPPFGREFRRPVVLCKTGATDHGPGTARILRASTIAPTDHRPLS